MSRYLDLLGEAPRVNFNTRVDFAATANMSWTPEGFLMCRNVPLARTGTQIYLGNEVPVEPGPDGTVVVERLPEEVFRPETIASFHGKPFTDNHPYEDVTPENYLRYFAGVILNPRRGEGDLSNYLLGDVLVYSKPVADAILAGKRQVSCGYDADYERVQAGYGLQRNILGNHVSLVDAGRCGPSCAILDQRTVDMATEKKGWFDKAIQPLLDKVRGAVKVSDSGEAEAAIAALQAELEKKDLEEGEAGEAHHTHVHLHMGESDSGSDEADADSDDDGDGDKDTDGDGDGLEAKDDDGDDDGSGDNQDQGDGDQTSGDDMANEIADTVAAAIKEALTPFAERLEKLEGTARDAAATALHAARDADPQGRNLQEVIARAEILKPGIQLQTFDAAPGTPQAVAAVEAFQRKALKESFATTDGRKAIEAATGSSYTDFDALPGAAISVIFRAASNSMRDANNAKAVAPQHAGPMEMRDGKLQPVTIASWNDANKKFWAERAKH